MARTTWLSLAAIVLELSLARIARAADAEIPPATVAQVQQAVDRATKYVRDESNNWLSTRKCAACHHAPLALWALAEAQRQGYEIDRQWVDDTIENLLGSKEKLLASKIFPIHRRRLTHVPRGED